MTTRRPRENPIDRALLARLSSGDTSGPFPPPTVHTRSLADLDPPRGMTRYAAFIDDANFVPIDRPPRHLSIAQEIDREFSRELRATYDRHNHDFSPSQALAEPPDPDPRAAIRRIIRESIARPGKPPPCR